MTESSETDWVELKRFSERAEAEQHALVLAAVSVGCRLSARSGEIALLVAPADAARARRELAAYARENLRARPAAPPVRGGVDALDGALAYGAAMVFLFSASRREAFGQDWLLAGAAQAGRIVSGEWWRALTALGLHADIGHLAANVVMGGVFGLLLARPLGAGLAWFAILLAGAAGNAINALLQSAGHTAIGASTAVFAGLGLLAALAWRDQGARRRWRPLAAGVMLLVYLGAGGARTDVGAHVAGFVTGGAVGAALAHADHRLPRGPGAQRAFAAATLALFAFAWLLALRAHG